MKKIFIVLAAAALAACSGPAFDPATVADATVEQVTRVEPLSWWTGMKMPLQLLVQGEKISAYDVTVEGGKGGKFEVVSTEDSTLVFTRTLPENKVTVKVELKAPWGWEIIAE